MVVKVVSLKSTLTNLSLVQSFQAHSNYIYRIKKSPFHSNYVAACSNDMTVKL
jgi:hypothetical protein